MRLLDRRCASKLGAEMSAFPYNATAISDFDPVERTELRLRKGDRVLVTAATNSEWANVRLLGSNNAGWVPFSHLRPDAGVATPAIPSPPVQQRPPPQQQPPQQYAGYGYPQQPAAHGGFAPATVASAAAAPYAATNAPGGYYQQPPSATCATQFNNNNSVGGYASQPPPACTPAAATGGSGNYNGAATGGYDASCPPPPPAYQSNDANSTGGAYGPPPPQYYTGQGYQVRDNTLSSYTSISPPNRTPVQIHLSYSYEPCYQKREYLLN